MKATVANTSEGRTKVVIDHNTNEIAQYFENLGGKKCGEFWIFQRSDYDCVIECLNDEGYAIKTTQLL